MKCPHISRKVLYNYIFIRVQVTYYQKIQYLPNIVSHHGKEHSLIIAGMFAAVNTWLGLVSTEGKSLILSRKSDKKFKNITIDNNY